MFFPNYNFYFTVTFPGRTQKQLLNEISNEKKQIYRKTFPVLRNNLCLGIDGNGDIVHNCADYVNGLGIIDNFHCADESVSSNAPGVSILKRDSPANKLNNKDLKSRSLLDLFQSNKVDIKGASDDKQQAKTDKLLFSNFINSILPKTNSDNNFNEPNSKFSSVKLDSGVNGESILKDLEASKLLQELTTSLTGKDNRSSFEGLDNSSKEQLNSDGDISYLPLKFLSLEANSSEENDPSLPDDTNILRPILLLPTIAASSSDTAVLVTPNPPTNATTCVCFCYPLSSSTVAQTTNPPLLSSERTTIASCPSNSPTNSTTICPTPESKLTLDIVGLLLNATTSAPLSSDPKLNTRVLSENSQYSSTNVSTLTETALPTTLPPYPPAVIPTTIKLQTQLPPYLDSIVSHMVASST